ncbi:hypothetical protein STRIP9103_00985 [Streptomyces ipomoeae 91-03]|uniref:Uncharacterized protein n=1 Tax=Streptomyces ipomoeae 91-03 TaxID=698759 RepID=L1KJ28_9ACTN|nr:hypothetical protein STRIP9103_00985 [Streptomyces ipomoeae 91-03]
MQRFTAGDSRSRGTILGRLRDWAGSDGVPARLVALTFPAMAGKDLAWCRGQILADDEMASGMVQLTGHALDESTTYPSMRDVLLAWCREAGGASRPDPALEELLRGGGPSLPWSARRQARFQGPCVSSEEARLLRRTGHQKVLRLLVVHGVCGGMTSANAGCEGSRAECGPGMVRILIAACARTCSGGVLVCEGPGSGGSLKGRVGYPYRHPRLPTRTAPSPWSSARRPVRPCAAVLRRCGAAVLQVASWAVGTRAVGGVRVPTMGALREL